MDVQTGMNLAGIELWHVLLSISILLALLAFMYAIISRGWRMRKSREEEVIEKLKEVNELKKRIEGRREGLTNATEIILVQIQTTMTTINAGINDLKMLILCSITMMVTLALAIMALP